MCKQFIQSLFGSDKPVSPMASGAAQAAVTSRESNPIVKLADEDPSLSTASRKRKKEEQATGVAGLGL